jgi:hypothetical protein
MPVIAPSAFAWPSAAAWPWGPRAEYSEHTEHTDPTEQPVIASPMSSVFNQAGGSSRARTTMALLNLALESDSLRAWSRRLGLSEQALRTARSRGRLSPAIAGSLAEELGEDPGTWIVIAALETERESACKTRMVRRFALGDHEVR